MKVRHFIYLSLLTLSALSVSSNLMANTCASLFENIKLSSLNRSDLQGHPENRINKPTVITEGTITDKDGSTFIVFKKIGEFWDSAYTPAPSNNQGDPRWTPIVLGSKTGNFFGFKKITENSIAVPTAETFNQRIKSANKKLLEMGIEAIQIHFHESGKEPETQMEYLYNVLKDSLPLSREGHYAVHDISYHSLAILLPKKVMDRLKVRIKLLIKLKEKIDNTQMPELEKKVLNEALEVGINRMVQFIDYGTGNIAPVLAFEQIGAKYNGKSFEAYDLRESVKGNLLDKTAGVFGSINSDINSRIQKMDIAIITEQLKNDPQNVKDLENQRRQISQLKKALEDFYKEFKNENKNIFRSFNQKYTTEEFVNSIRAKISALKSMPNYEATSDSK